MELRRLTQTFFTAARPRHFLLGAVVLALLFGGVQLRRLTWRETTHLRFQHDIVNGFYWGSQTLAEGRRLSLGEGGDSWRAFFRGYFALYDRVADDASGGEYNLDYPPLRLLVMSVWAKQVHENFPGVEDGTPKYVEPLLHLNLLCEILSAAGIFLLVRLGLKRAAGATNSRFLHRIPPAQRGWVCGLVAASVVWFEPSMILDAHGWPQWDVWILPFYIFATLAALTRRWFWCGCLLAAGGMLKGQLLFVAPFFVLWPLWQKRWVRAGRVLAGFAATSALLVSPWLLHHPPGWAIVALAGAATTVFLWRRGSPNAGAWAAGVAALAAFTIGAIWDGSFAWWKIGFAYGSEHYPYLFISSCYNLPSLLADRHWSLKTPFWSWTLGALHLNFTLQWTLRLVYLGALALCALGAARHARRREPRLLIAIAAPWVLMFALLGQMHERYLLWGAVLSAVALGVSVRLSILHFLFSGMSAAMITQVLLVDKKLDTLHAIELLQGVRPIASWVLLAAAGVWFWDVLSIRSPLFQARRKRLPTKEEPILALTAPEKA